MNYNQAISDLVGTISGIHGAFLYDEGQGVLTVQGNLHLQKSNMTEIAEKIVENYNVTARYFDDIKEMFFCFQDTMIFACSIAKNRWLYVVYDASMNQSVLQQNIKQALHSRGTEYDSFVHRSTYNEKSSFNRPQGGDATCTDLDSLLRTKPDLQEPLGIIRKELTAIIGPVAEIVFSDAVEDWLQVNRPSHATLGKLAEFIEVEIGSTDMINAFRTRLLNTLDITGIL